MGRYWPCPFRNFTGDKEVKVFKLHTQKNCNKLSDWRVNDNQEITPLQEQLILSTSGCKARHAVINSRQAGVVSKVWNYNTCHKLLKKHLFFLSFFENFLQLLFSPLFSLKRAPLLPQCCTMRILEHWDDYNTQVNICVEKSHKCFKICDEYCSNKTV